MPLLPRRREHARACKQASQQELTIKRQVICRLREGLREGERVANLFSLPFLKKVKTKPDERFYFNRPSGSIIIKLLNIKY